jgi:hypothetical protein
MQIHLEVEESQIPAMVNSLAPLGFSVTPPGIHLYGMLDFASEGKPLHIVETGIARDPNLTALMSDGWSSFYFAKWVAEHPGSTFTTIELNKANLEYGKIFLERFDLADGVNFVNGESVEEIGKLQEPVDVFYLDSCDGVDHGLSEFQASLAHKPKIIIMDDFVSKAAKAVSFAQQTGIPYQQVDRYSLFKPSYI